MVPFNSLLVNSKRELLTKTLPFSGQRTPTSLPQQATTQTSTCFTGAMRRWSWTSRPCRAAALWSTGRTCLGASRTSPQGGRTASTSLRWYSALAGGRGFRSKSQPPRMLWNYSEYESAVFEFFWNLHIFQPEVTFESPYASTMHLETSRWPVLALSVP